MYIGHIAGIAFLPVSVILFLNLFGVTNMQTIFGFNILLIAAAGIIFTEIGDIMDAHLRGDFVIIAWIICIILCIPAFLYLFSTYASPLPSNIATQLPLIMACFLFVEGASSFFIGGA